MSCDSVYVLGGLIDRTVRSRVSLDRAQQEGAIARRLPLREYAPREDIHPILSLNAVWSILADVHGGSAWEAAIERALPGRYVSRRVRDEALRKESTAPIYRKQ